MLINVAIVFIRDFLPMCILLCLVSVFVFGGLNNRFNFIAFICSALFGVVLFKLYPMVSDCLDGAGVEVIQAASYLSGYLFLLSGTCVYLRYKVGNPHMLDIERFDTEKKELFDFAKLATALLTVGVSLWVALNISVFSVFIGGYITREVKIEILMLGLFIGVGICFSFSSLFYFSLEWLREKMFFKPLLVIWAVFLSGQLSQSINLLTQVDLIQQSNALWDTRWLVDDSSEYGHILRVLVGYEATPSFTYLLTFLLGAIVPILLVFVTLKGDPLKSQRVLEG